MTVYENVQSTVKPERIEFDEYSVWINENISEITVSDGNGEHTEYTFKQTQYSKDEYISIMDKRNTDLKEMITDTQIALCDVYEMIGG